MSRLRSIVPGAAAVLLGLLVAASGGPADGPADRAKAQKLLKDGNFKEAWELFSRLVLDPATDPVAAGEDLESAVQCLQQLNREHEIDAFREKAVATHPRNPRLLWAAARTLINGNPGGFVVAGEFQRGSHRGGGEWVNSHERDRVRALQLLVAARAAAAGGESLDASQRARLHLSLADALLGQHTNRESWRLQYLTDLDTLPDYDRGNAWWVRSTSGAPVDAEGRPILHRVPESWEAARSDGERWRWALVQTAELDASLARHTRERFAEFLLSQFGVQTMADYGWFFARSEEDAKGPRATWALHTLGEDETMARLATGIQRFKLPDEFNPIRVFQELEAHARLGQIFEDRRQYPKAAEHWRRAGQQGHVDQIVKPWGAFEPVMTQPAGRGATIELRFRNGKQVSFEAREVNVAKLLGDVKEYLASRPGKLDWDRMNIADVGWNILEKDRQQYLARTPAATWDLELEPRPNHFDRRVTVATPLQKAGAWLLTARMDQGNTFSAVLWIADTAIVKKSVAEGTWYYVADAVTGEPIPRANVEFFGYHGEWKNRLSGQVFDVETRQFAELTDADGQLVLDAKRQPPDHQWVVTATTGSGRHAFLGFTNVWYGRPTDAAFDQPRTFAITDRPVYRPGQSVQFKLWVQKAKYEATGPSPYAGRTFKLRITNPKNETVLEQDYTADGSGGFHGEHALPSGAPLGVWRLQLLSDPGGGGQFRVEEYKKPEFEVQVEAPDEPVQLGEKIAAKVRAKYYFGAPVTEARVHWKVLRSEHDARWYPPHRWDWLYGPGYWWFAYDYDWWPGWGEWGCRRPISWWWPRWPAPPEVVAEGDATLGADGTLAIPIDTALALAVHPDRDHRYAITAEVTDRSRRTITGQGAVLVARKPFQVNVWVDRGWLRTGETLTARCNARTIDGQPVAGAKARMELLKVAWKGDAPAETAVEAWELVTGPDGQGEVRVRAAEAGQYRLRCAVTDAKERRIEGGYVFTAYGAGAGEEFRFSDLELVADRTEYRPGDEVQLRVNTNRRDGVVLLFDRPVHGFYRKPKLVRLKGRSELETIPVALPDMPGFFVEAVTIGDAKVFTEMREIVVPPESRVVDVKLAPSAATYKPGAPAKVQVTATDAAGKPFAGSLVVAMYDKSLEYIAGGSNVAEIRAFFWKWRRQHHPRTDSTLQKGGHNLVRPGAPAMGLLGVFGQTVPEESESELRNEKSRSRRFGMGGRGRAAGVRADGAAAPASAAPAGEVAADKLGAMLDAKEEGGWDDGGGGGELVEPTVRSKFADTAFWAPALRTGADGAAEVSLTMPENLTAWRTRAWVLGDGTRVGEASIDVVTAKDLLVRLQAPRFFVQKDEVVLSANVHNYLKTDKRARVELELGGGCLEPMPGVAAALTVDVPAGGERRVDWRVRATRAGEAVVRMKALTDEESDAMEMRFPVHVHGMLKTESWSGAVRPEGTEAALTVRVPAERRPEETRLEVRWSPTLALAMVDALPYLVEYPYGCTEQTLNRFLPTVLTQKVLLGMGVRLEDVRKKITNLNAQEIGDDQKRAADWERLAATKRWDGERWVDRNPVFDEAAVLDMVKAGVQRLTALQCGDGGWGWFGGMGERSFAHTTAVVVHGLQIARACDVALVPGVLERGVEWLRRDQAAEVEKLRNWPKKKDPRKELASDLDALVYRTLVDAKIDDDAMREFLWRDRAGLSVYAKALLGLAWHAAGRVEMRDMAVRNVMQFLVEDEENQTAHLELGNQGYWWWWYGSEIEAHASALQLLVAVEPKGERASRLVKYLLNNRRHGSRWNSTRDTALVVEAFADYLRASGEERPELELEVRVDGRKVKDVRIDADNLFAFDNRLVLRGSALSDGEHRIELVKRGRGPLYWNAYLTNFTLEDPIARAGLEVKVERSVYRLVPVDKKIADPGSRGQVVDRKVEKFERLPVGSEDVLRSGDLVEIELVLESKNDYEYLVIEDLKAAGCEPVEVRSGYGGNPLGAYLELRDDRAAFFLRELPRGRHSLSYRLRAEIPGRFSALPARASAMYAPELKANSDEAKLRIED
jgi:uncharacterized protein YfaS (alpha-2-macroglobulin family)